MQKKCLGEFFFLVGNSVWFNDALIHVYHFSPFIVRVSNEDISQMFEHQLNTMKHITFCWVEREKKKWYKTKRSTSKSKKERKHTQRTQIHTHHISGHLLFLMVDIWSLSKKKIMKQTETVFSHPNIHDNETKRYAARRRDYVHYSDISSIYVTTPNM